MARRTRRPSRPSPLDPAELHAERSFEFVQGALRAARRRRAEILEVGCGHGQLARRLIAAGHRVTAIDRSPRMVRAARRIGVPVRESDFLDYDGGPFDAIVFVLSLHHVASLPGAVANAHRLLKPGGLLLLDEFGRERVDRNTAAWFFAGIDLLAAAGILEHEDPGPYWEPKKRRGAARGKHTAPVPEDPLARWRMRHRRAQAIHTGRSLEAAVRRRFRIVRREHGPHLFRYAGRRLHRGAAGVRVARYLLESELKLIARGRLRAAGLRIVARRSAARS